MKIIVFIEKNPVTGALRDVSIELAYKAYSLVKPFQGEVVGVFVGDKLPEDCEQVFQFGLHRLVSFRSHAHRPRFGAFIGKHA